VCDGRKLLILENAGNAEYPELRTREVDKTFMPPTAALGTDAPGRVHQSVGTERSAYEQTDWHDKAEVEFLTDLVHRLDAAVQSNAVKHLVIVAPPRALGALRQAYTPRLRAALQAEIDKDLTALPVDEIQRRLTGG